MVDDTPPPTVTNTTVPTGTQDETNEIGSIGKLRIPDFFKENVELWFWQVEAAFSTNGIRSDTKKYYAIISSLPSSVIFKISEFRQNPPIINMYETLKTKIIQEFSDSEQTKITKLLQNLPLGDRKPSELLAEMRAKSANTQVSKRLLSQLWIRNSPESIRVILSISDELSLEKQSECADKIHESMNNGSIFNREVNTISKFSESKTLKDLESMVIDLKKELNKLKNFRGRSRNRSKTPNRSNDQNNYCWYHRKFASKATKCNKPCEFQTLTKN